MDRQEMLDQAIRNSLEYLESLEPGSKEYLNQSESIERLYKLTNEEYRVVMEAENQAAKTKADIKKHSRVSADTIVKVGTVIVLTVGTSIYTTKGGLTPQVILKTIDKIRIF